MPQSKPPLRETDTSCCQILQQKLDSLAPDPPSQSCRKCQNYKEVTPRAGNRGLVPLGHPGVDKTLHTPRRASRPSLLLHATRQPGNQLTLNLRGYPSLLCTKDSNRVPRVQSIHKEVHSQRWPSVAATTQTCDNRPRLCGGCSLGLRRNTLLRLTALIPDGRYRAVHSATRVASPTVATKKGRPLMD